MNYTIDATGKKLGRLATEVATILMGKNSPEFTRNNLSGNTVTVTNASKLIISEEKLQDKKYLSFSGYPGGLKKTQMGRLIEKKGHGEIIRIAVRGMLPANRLRKEMLKSLIITE